MRPAAVCAAALSGWVALAVVATALFVIRCLARADDDELLAPLVRVDVPAPGRDWSDELLRKCMEAGRP